MSASKSNGKKKRVAAGSSILNPDTKLRASTPDDLDPHVSNDFQGIMNMMLQFKEKAKKDGQKKKDETLSSVATEIKSRIEELKSKTEKDRQALAKSLSKSSKECDNSLKNETEKFSKLCEKFCKEKDAHSQNLRDAMSKLEEEKERFFMRYEQLRKKEKSAIGELQKSCAEKISQLESSFKKQKQDDKAFTMLKKTIGSFLDNGSDEETEEFPTDD